MHCGHPPDPPPCRAAWTGAACDQFGRVCIMRRGAASHRTCLRDVSASAQIRPATRHTLRTEPAHTLHKSPARLTPHLPLPIIPNPSSLPQDAHTHTHTRTHALTHGVPNPALSPTKLSLCLDSLAPSCLSFCGLREGSVGHLRSCALLYPPHHPFISSPHYSKRPPPHRAPLVCPHQK